MKPLKLISPAEDRRRWHHRLMRDRFVTVLVTRLRSGKPIPPALFHKYTIPHAHHCFRMYTFRIHPFNWYLRRHRVARKAAAAGMVKRLASACPTLSRLMTRVKIIKTENTRFLKTNPILRRTLSQLTPFQVAGCAKLFDMAFPEKRTQFKPHPILTQVSPMEVFLSLLKTVEPSAP